MSSAEASDQREKTQELVRELIDNLQINVMQTKAVPMRVQLIEEGRNAIIQVIIQILLKFEITLTSYNVNFTVFDCEDNPAEKRYDMNSYIDVETDRVLNDGKVRIEMPFQIPYQMTAQAANDLEA